MKVIFILLILSSFAFSHESTDSLNIFPLVKPTYHIIKTEEKIELDGKLNEAVWRKAEKATNFAEIDPGDNVRPPVRTEAWLVYDHDNLYLAMRCYDNPDEIRAHLRNRDRIFDDDFAGVFLDTYGNNSWGYFLTANPFGIQGDIRLSGTNGDDVNFDMLFESAGRITDDGYIIELKIPFSSMRFPNKEIQKWRINFWRNRPHETRGQYSWCAISRDNPCWMCQTAYLEGLESVQSGHAVYLIPSLVAADAGNLEDSDDPGSDFKWERPEAEFGFTAKWTVTPSLTLEGTLNPDFSQVESDAQQIDVNQTFALFYPEKRPFFQEGADLFNTDIRAVYTRSINDPIGAAKVIGRWTKTTLGVLSAVDQNTPVLLPFEEESGFVALETSFSNIARFKQVFNQDDFIGGLITNRQYSEGGSGSVLSVDGFYRLSKNYNISYQFIASSTVEPNDTALTEDYKGEKFADGKYTADFDGESYWGEAVSLKLSRDARYLNFGLFYNQKSPTFRAANGFIAGNNSRFGMINVDYVFYFDNNPWLVRITPGINVAKKYNYYGLLKDEWFSPGINLRFRAQTFVKLSLLFDNENFKRRMYKNLTRFEMVFNTDFSNVFQFGFFSRYGYFVGNRWDDVPVRARGLETFNMWFSIKPTDKLILTPVFSYAQAADAVSGEELYSGYIARVKATYQFTPELSLRLIGQYDHFSETFSLEPLISYRLNAFSAFYLGANSGLYDFRYSGTPEYQSYGWRVRDAQIFVKFRYLFNI